MKRLTCFLALLLVFAINGCNAQINKEASMPQSTVKNIDTQLDDTTTKRATAYRVGLSLQDDSPFVMRVGNQLKELVEEGDGDIELVIYNGMANANAQISHVESFISSGFDMVILNPISYEDCAMAVTIAKNAGVPLITTIAQTYNPTGYMSFVGSDHYESGVIQARMVARYLNGFGSVVILEGVMGISPQIGRYNGYMEVFKHYPGIEIMAVQTAAWQRDEAYAIVENWIRNEKPFSVVISENDNMAMGALEAIEEYGKQDEIAVFGIDGDADALKAVLEGRLEGTVFHNGKEIAGTLYECILQFKSYETLKESYMIPFEPVTARNADKYLRAYYD